MLFGCQLLVPHGGIFAILIPGAAVNLALYLVAIVIGALTTTAVVAVLKVLRPSSVAAPRERERLATA
jgi:PTS system fructose-specific IIC component